MTSDKLVRAGLDHVDGRDKALAVRDGYEMTELVEAHDLREAFVDISALERMIEDDEALVVLERQHEFKFDGDVNRLELVAENAQCLEWNLDS